MYKVHVYQRTISTDFESKLRYCSSTQCSEGVPRCVFSGLSDAHFEMYLLIWQQFHMGKTQASFMILTRITFPANLEPNERTIGRDLNIWHRWFRTILFNEPVCRLKRFGVVSNIIIPSTVRFSSIVFKSCLNVNLIIESTKYETSN